MPQQPGQWWPLQLSDTEAEDGELLRLLLLSLESRLLHQSDPCRTGGGGA